MNHPPRNKQGRSGEPSLWVGQPADDALPLLEDALRGMNRHFGLKNTPMTFTRCLRRMPGFEGFWFSYRTSSAETSLTPGNAASWQNQSDLRSARAAK